MTVPILALYDYVDKSGAQTVTRGGIKVVSSTPTTALVAVDTQFGAMKFTDMFALVRDGESWKIVAKIYWQTITPARGCELKCACRHRRSGWSTSAARSFRVAKVARARGSAPTAKPASRCVPTKAITSFFGAA